MAGGDLKPTITPQIKCGATTALPDFYRHQGDDGSLQLYFLLRGAVQHITPHPSAMGDAAQGYTSQLLLLSVWLARLQGDGPAFSVDQHQEFPASIGDLEDAVFCRDFSRKLLLTLWKLESCCFDR